VWTVTFVFEACNGPLLALVRLTFNAHNASFLVLLLIQRQANKSRFEDWDCHIWFTQFSGSSKRGRLGTHYPGIEVSNYTGNAGNRS